MNNTRIQYCGIEKIDLLDIITASYFTEGEEIRYRGNPGRIEPILKLTGNVSNARDLVLAPEDNTIIGLVVLGSDIIERGKTELPELINRQSLTNVLLSCNLHANCCVPILDEVSEANLFSCTREMLEQNDALIVENTSLCRELHKQKYNILNHTVKPIIVTTEKSWNDYCELRRKLSIIRRAEIHKEYKDGFLMNAYSLLNLFRSAVFSISRMDELIGHSLLPIESPLKKIEKMHTYSGNFPDIYQDTAMYIIDELKEYKSEIVDKCQLEKCLINYLSMNRTKKIGVVAPKAYYSDIMAANSLQTIMSRPSLLSVSTPNRFDDSVFYDEIISVGDLSGHRFSTFRCHASANTSVLLYDFEINNFKKSEKIAASIERKMNGKSNENTFIANGSDDNEYIDDSFSENTISRTSMAEMKEIEIMENEMEEYIDSIIYDMAIRGIITASNNGTNLTTEAVKLGTFHDGQNIFFTKSYKAYVFDIFKEEVNEVTVSDLSAGDTLVFTKNSTFTKDIIDEILRRFIISNKAEEKFKDAYEKVSFWKNTLRKFMETYGFGYSDISSKMKSLGASRTAAAIRSWLDEEAHIIGPKDPEVYECIAKITGNEKLLCSYENYCGASETIRIVRRRILRVLGTAIINRLCGRSSNDDYLHKVVAENIDELVLILELKSITDIDGIQVPNYIINHPISN
jgi:hypothetical protein